MLALVCFGIGLFYGCFLWYQSMKEYDALYQEYIDLLKELEERRPFYTRKESVN